MTDVIWRSADAQSSDTMHTVARMIADAVSAKKPIESVSPQRARAADEKSGNYFAPAARTLASVVDERLMSSSPSGEREIPVRIYTPIDSDEPLPGLVFFHGGGFVIGSINTHDLICQNIAAESSMIVISVDYRLAPEAKYPEPTDDALSAFRWAQANAERLGIDSHKVAVGGDSAGGNLAAVTCLRCRDLGEPLPAAQMLWYPVTDCLAETRSREAFGEGHFLTSSTLAWFLSLYLEDPTQAELPYVSPMRAPDLSGLPPTLMITAGYDVLRDEGYEYVNKLQQAGVNASHTCYNSMIHGFISFAGEIPDGMEAIKESARFLRREMCP